MFQIQTQKVRLIPLPYTERVLLSENKHKLEKSLGLEHSVLELNADESFIAAYSEALSNPAWISKVKDHEADYEWYTHWLIVDPYQNIIIGGIGASGLPDENGKVMIGYYIDHKYEGKGFTTEAVRLFIEWMSKNKQLKSIIADTLVDGLASQRVLIKNGFVLAGEAEEGLRWQLTF
jgi:ribosomal-protein-alanine N-acetyltransferase